MNGDANETVRATDVTRPSWVRQATREREDVARRHLPTEAPTPERRLRGSL